MSLHVDDSRNHGSKAFSAPFPIVPANSIRLTADQSKRCEQVAQSLLGEEPSLPRIEPFGKKVSAGWAPGPTVAYEDHVAIALVSKEKALGYEYRSLCLVGDGDFFLLSREHSPAYETYLTDVVGLGAPTLIHLDRDGVRPSLGQACLRDQSLVRRLAVAAQAAGNLNILPYLATGFSWLLAGAVSEMAGVPVHVTAPPPNIAKRANDKLWFAHIVHRLLGPDALPPTRPAYGPAAAAARLRKLAEGSSQVVVKLPSSASAMGNLSMPAAQVRTMTLDDLRKFLLSALHKTGWRDRYPILIGIWEAQAVSSPSAQIWIPPKGDGPPAIEGLFVQTLQGSGGEFVGAVSANVPFVREVVEREALMLATVMQSIGYVGRMSLDALLVGEDYQSAKVHWIECNARWGGVSLPLTLANRLGAKVDAIAIAQRHLAPAHCPPDFSTGLDRIATRLFRHDGPRSGVICLRPFGGGELTVDLMATGENVEEATRSINAAFADLGITD